MDENRQENSAANEGDETPEPIGRKKCKRSRSPAQLEENFHPLQCNPQNLWHLRFGHSSATTLQKLKPSPTSIPQHAMSAYVQNKPRNIIIQLKKRQNESSNESIQIFAANILTPKATQYTI